MLREEYPKFGAYQDPSDVAYFDWVWDGEQPTKTLAARIMDLADDVAYAVHDFEDGVWAGMIPLYELLLGNERETAALERMVLEQDDRRLFSHGEFPDILASLLDSED